MQINGNIKNNFTYEGQVSFKLKHKGKVYSFLQHNEGTQKLTDLIVKALIGSDDVSNLRPQFLGFYQKKVNYDGETETTYETPLLNNLIPFTGIVGDFSNTTQNAQTSIKLTATILQSDLQGNMDVESGQTELAIYSVNGIDKLATISSSSLTDMYKNICEGVEAIVEWEMIFKCEREVPTV